VSIDGLKRVLEYLVIFSCEFRGLSIPTGRLDSLQEYNRTARCSPQINAVRLSFRYMLETPNVAASLVPFQDASCFDVPWMFGAQIGKDTTSNFAFSFNGLAIRNIDNRFVVLELDGAGVKVTDVTCFTIGLDPLVYRIPVLNTDVKRGDYLIRSDAPFSLVFVTELVNEHRIKGIDPRTNEVVEIVVPDRQLDMPNFLVKAVSLLGSFDITGGSDSDLGGLLPLLLLGGGGVAALNTNNNLILALALSKGGGSAIDRNLLLLMLATGGSSQSTSAMQPLLLASLFNKKKDTPQSSDVLQKLQALKDQLTAQQKEIEALKKKT
jgi:hypothetical protein